jgi:tRNA 5-methylaminomethyl-2-thiouridine biosynthesis bifunctional protein
MRVINNINLSNHAQIEWHGGQPYASAFQDVYFSSDNGLLETEYVFLQGNDLFSRWENFDAETFTIAETGFGTGLNFLCAAKLWLATAPKNAVLHYISVEKHPLNLQDLSAALQLWPELKELSAQLLNNYENLLIGADLTLIDGRIQLTLLIGDATECLTKNPFLPPPCKVGTKVEVDSRICQGNHSTQHVNAWFLDGFSPAKNPDMWQPALFAQIAKLSNTETTIATFTSAGAVRRGLIAAGFDIIKRAGFSKKREMLTGRFTGVINAA